MNIQTFTCNPFQENTYILYDESKDALVIDAGCLFPQEQQEIKDFIIDNGLHVTRVINTHLHLDHQFGNKFLSDTFGVAPEAHESDEFFIAAFPLQVQAFGLSGLVAGEAQPLKGHIADNEIITFGHTSLTAMLVPGHSPGSLAFYNAEEGVLFSGDVLFRESIGRSDLAGGDYSTLLHSITSRLFSLPDATIIYPGHGENTTIGHEKRNNPFLQPQNV